MSSKPDILFILTDDQRFDAIAAPGHPEIRTPKMDRLTSHLGGRVGRYG
ncbi:MAG TPA: hypothetical protein VJ960_06570 [Oceanipulchritudo sp.]|nr:hypothetical protein [Oceanipulchritudo sp.]